ncbi:MAG: hypothetical protein IMHGJWDQ_001992 [Candidatus Fervidibacter sp.]
MRYAWLALVGVSCTFAAWAVWQQAPAPPQPPQFVALFSIEVEPGNGQTFIDRFQQRAKLVDKAKGFRGLFVLQHSENAHKFVVMTLWDRAEDFRAWVNSEEFRKAHAQGGVPAKAMQLDTYLVRLVASKPDAKE